ncbi:MAG: right-handed parallel beta-helix repeat-containing protein [Anaerolineae bacterium]|nr:right-handed parallel beta-helix repeat-containing protein [Anaerolineae bacterium]
MFNFVQFRKAIFVSGGRTRGAALFAIIGLLLVLCVPQVGAAGTVEVSPYNMNDWGFLQEVGTAMNPGTGQMVLGPGFPPLGLGSAQLAISDSSTGESIGSLMLAGTPLSSFTRLEYQTYRSVGTGNNTITLQLVASYPDYNTAVPTSGRVVFEPANGVVPPTIVNDTWQTWNALDTNARWWITGPADGAPCRQASPCLWGDLLTTYPGVQIFPNVNVGGVLLKAGSGGGWNPFSGNVDGLIIGVSGDETTYNFEPCVTPTVENTDTGEMFCTIQAAIDDEQTVAGHTIQLDAVTYTELVDITKSITLQGQVGTIIQSSENIPDFTSNHNGSILWIQATDVVIQDLEIDGDNPAISGGYIHGGADINAVRGIYMNSAFNNSLIDNVTFRNLGRGINLYAGQNHTIRNNTAENLGGPNNGNYGYGILLMGNTSAQITNNTVDGALTAGIFMQNNHSASNIRITNNTISNSGIGLGWNMLYGGANGLIEDNVATNVELGMQVTSITNGYLEIHNNDLTMTAGNGEQGFYVWNTSPDMVLITGNTLTGGDEGVALFDDSAAFNLAQAHLQLTGNTIQDTGTAVAITSNSSAHAVTLRATGNTIQNATTGISYNGTESIDSATVAGNAFDNVSTVFDVATTGSLFAYANNITGFTTGVNNTSGALNARHNWWGAITPGGVNDADAFDYRLGAQMSSWGEGTLGGASLNTATGSGTGVIVSHGRGLANVPFGKGNNPYASATCSDYYDFFVLDASGDWTVSVPVDDYGDGTCDPTLAQKALYQFALDETMPDTDCIGGACWNLPAVVTVNGRSLQVTLEALTYLQGTPFVAGDNTPDSNDPTAVSLTTFSASTNHIGVGTAVILLLLTLTTLIFWKRRAA